MLEDDTTTTTLSQKIENLLLKYHEMKIENENLRNELFSTKAQNEAKDIEIAKLENELRVKSGESDELLMKIEAVLDI